MTNKNNQFLPTRIPIYGADLDIFRIDESCDIHQVIVNKNTKYDVSATNPNNFVQIFIN